MALTWILPPFHKADCSIKEYLTCWIVNKWIHTSEIWSPMKVESKVRCKELLIIPFHPHRFILAKVKLYLLQWIMPHVKWHVISSLFLFQVLSAAGSALFHTYSSLEFLFRHSSFQCNNVLSLETKLGTMMILSISEVLLSWHTSYTFQSSCEMAMPYGNHGHDHIYPVLGSLVATYFIVFRDK